MRPVANERPSAAALPDPTQPFQILCALASGQPCQLGGRQGRHRHDPSAVEVRNLGRLCSRPPARPLQSTNSLSWASRCHNPNHLAGGPPTTVSPRYLPAICPAFPHTVAIVEAHQMRRPRPHLPPRPGGLPLPSQPASQQASKPSQPSPDQAHVAIVTAVPTLLRFRSHKTRQVGLRNGRSRHGPAAPPSPSACPPSRSPSHGALVVAPPVLQRISILPYG